MILGLAPMDGITDLAYRLVVQDIFATHNTDAHNTLRTRTEFMNANGYMITPHKLIRHMLHIKNSKLSEFNKKQKTESTESTNFFIGQIYGGNENTLVETAIDLQKKYPDLDGIELNIGCPSPKVIACGGGSGMMHNKQRTLEILRHLASEISLPFSIKVRTGLTESDKNAQFDFLVQASQYCKIISIHGRTFKQGHSGENDRDFIYRFKDTVGEKNIIIGNGGIISYEDACSRKKNLDGIMIGQAAIGNPRIFINHEPTVEERFICARTHLELAVACEIYFKDNIQEPEGEEIIHNRKYLHMLKKCEEDTDELDSSYSIAPHLYTFPMPTKNDIEIIREDIRNKKFSNESSLRSPIEFRKYLFNYIKGIPGNKEFKQKISTITTYAEIQEAIKLFFQK